MSKQGSDSGGEAQGFANAKPGTGPDTVPAAPNNFIIGLIEEDIANKRYSRPICTRFPPEPNGYMHMGHAKAVTIGHDLAERFHGLFNLRMDDTNPAAEDLEYVEAMQRDVEWLLGKSLEGRVFHASDYYPQLYAYAEQLIQKDHAYVEELTAEQIKEYRGNYHAAGRPSPFRNRPPEESLRLFREMRAGKFAPGERVLRAKIDPASPNMNMRDPIVYRILTDVHHRAGAWHIYPMYDYAHPLSDAIEGITHSTCGKEFANHRPLYDWFLEKLEIKEPPRQIEFAEIGITGIVLGKRHLRKLVEQKIVSGWDDPRMPTIRGLRRRGCPQAAIWQFCRELGVSNSSPGEVHVDRLEHAMREVLNRTSPRVMGVLYPLKVVIENYPDDRVETFDVIKNPENPADGTLSRPFSKELYIDRADFMEDPPKKYHRLSPGKEVRLRYAYLITCTGVVKDPATGEVIELRATYDPLSQGGEPADGRKVQGTLHWVSARHALHAEVRLYDSLFTPEVEQFEKSERPIEEFINPASLEVLTDAVVEPSLRGVAAGERVQFERVGYFAVDPDSTPERPVFNRTVELRDKKFSKIFQK